MKKVSFFTTLLFICLQSTGYCQIDSVLTNVTAKLRSLSGSRAIEKAYLHFDKPFYAAGDTIYFTAYVTLGEKHALTNLSGIVYVDLINDKNVIKQSIKLQLISGIGWGDFALPDTLHKGNYRVRAYTNYMRNYGDNNFFDQIIPVGSVSDNSVIGSAAATIVAYKTDVEFFPEGGELVAGLPSKVAFKATGSNGLGADIHGTIIDNTHAEILKFTSAHLGMGTFLFRPEADKTYFAEVAFADGSRITIPLPKPEISGITLAVKDTLNKLAIEIRCNKAYFQENHDKDILLVMYGSGFASKVTSKLNARTLSIDVLKSQFPTGILQVTLFSDTGDPLAERLSFIQNDDLLNLAVNTDKPIYHQREQVKISLKAALKDGTKAQGHFSVSVTDESKVPVDENNEPTILTDLLLTSDLKGYIEQPNYYFTHNIPEVNAKLDALMLTQGYRRFAWKQLLHDNTITALQYQPESLMEISGLLKTPTGTLPKKENVIIRTASNTFFDSEPVNNDGIFKFSNLSYTGKTDFIIQPEKYNRKAPPKITVNIDKPLPPVYAALVPAQQADVTFSMTTYLKNELLAQSQWQKDKPAKSIVLKHVSIYDKKDYRSSNLGGAGHADQVVKGDNLLNTPVLSVALRGILRGVDFEDGVPYMRIANTISYSGEKQNKMLVIIDGENMGQFNIDQIPVTAVETIELLKYANASIYGVEGGAGVLVITTRQTLSIPIEPTTATALGMLEFQAKGFYKAREFYQPKYPNPALSNKTDLRSTIFWKPELTTDKEGNAAFEYFNADGTGSYRVVIEGIDNAGNLGRQVYHYKVQ